MRFGSVAALFVFVAGPWGSSLQQTPSITSVSTSSWVLTRSDEFNATIGSAPDPTKWVIETGGNGWGNGELEYHTPRRQNLHQENVGGLPGSRDSTTVFPHRMLADYVCAYSRG